MCKLAMVTIVAVSFAACGLRCCSVLAQSRGAVHSAFPKACFFFAQQVGSGESGGERAYKSSFAEVYRQWCTPDRSTPNQRMSAVNTLVKRWKEVWDRNDPYNASFHETGASDLLELIGLTHKLPAQMVSDPEFTKEWVKACKESCFTIWEVPENPTAEHGLAMQLWLRNDLLDNLRREPASEPVIHMLQDARFRLVD